MTEKRKKERKQEIKKERKKERNRETERERERGSKMQRKILSPEVLKHKSNQIMIIFPTKNQLFSFNLNRSTP